MGRITSFMTLLFMVVFAGLSLLHVSWLAPDPAGRPKLIAAKPAELPRDRAGCFQAAPGAAFWNTQYGNSAGLEVQMLQLAAGNSADAVVIDTEVKDGELLLKRSFESDCARDNALPRANAVDAFSALSKPERFIHVKDAAGATLLAENPPAGENAAVYFAANDAGIALLADRPAFSVESARACASDYKSGGWLGSVPDSCHGETMLLTLDDLGITLWGWPDRFLARMNEADVRVIIAAGVRGGEITGLTELTQYDEIARSYNGYIWIDNIEEMGPALKPDE